MVRRMIFVICCVLLTTVAYAGNIASVNIQRVITESKIGKDAQIKLVAIQDANKGELRTLVEERDAAVKMFNSKAAQDVSGNFEAYTELVAAKRLAESAEARLKNAQEDANAEIQNMQVILSKEVEDKIAAVIQGVATAEGYDLVLATGAHGVRFITPDSDITQLVLDKLSE